ncbi:Mitochondrial Carrier (MC) Family [Thraustotheca clavata]|uniref:Mitochondrial Carrier (MC) Family n=1 Tax=Thraustotheca clavata TaxID=74557 RepID=A0A1W0A530_9STRA|nr:Mitochondrial Carrier (MC) Family [Thraustotheca clavata]
MNDKQTTEEGRPRLLRRHTTGVVSFGGDPGDVCTETADVDHDSRLLDEITKQASVLLAGGIAGSVGKTCTAPLSRLTILFQVHSMVSATHKGKFSESLPQAFMKVVRNEGILSLWKGNGASVVHRFPYSAVNFFTYELIKGSFASANLDNDVSQSAQMSMNFVSGAMAAATSTSVCYPIDLIRTRLITQLDKDIRYRGISHAFHRIRAEEGTRGLYRGLSATLFVTVPNMAINFTMFETLKEKALAHRSEQAQREIQTLTVLDTLFCGGLSGILSSSITFPVDVIRRRMQISGIHGGSSNVTALAIARELFAEQGIRGFYRGLAPELLKVIPMVGITFGSFDYIKRHLEITR